MNAPSSAQSPTSASFLPSPAPSFSSPMSITTNTNSTRTAPAYTLTIINATKYAPIMTIIPAAPSIESSIDIAAFTYPRARITPSAPPSVMAHKT